MHISAPLSQIPGYAPVTYRGEIFTLGYVCANNPPILHTIEVKIAHLESKSKKLKLNKCQDLLAKSKGDETIHGKVESVDVAVPKPTAVPYFDT